MRRGVDWVESLAYRTYATPILFVLAFAESIFFPIPVDVLLIALCVGAPRKSFYFALVAAVGSVLGGGGGYALGYWMWYDSAGDFSRLAVFFFDVVPGFSREIFASAAELYREYDFWAVFIAGVSPVPYKVATITAGVFDINFWVFSLSSIISRAVRYFAVGAMFFFFGPQIKAFIDKYFEILSVIFVLTLIGGFVVIRYVV